MKRFLEEVLVPAVIALTVMIGVVAVLQRLPHLLP